MRRRPSSRAPKLPPLEPMSVEESATDLTLFVQELIKLRSNGRTRRYEVLARSRATRTATKCRRRSSPSPRKGKEGAALDAFVVQRLLTWLGEHGEVMWDSEPASFSVNLSIGAHRRSESSPSESPVAESKRSARRAHRLRDHGIRLRSVQAAGAALRRAVREAGLLPGASTTSPSTRTVFEPARLEARCAHVKIDPKLTNVAMKDKLPQALVVAIAAGVQGAGRPLRRQAHRLAGRAAVAHRGGLRFRPGLRAREAPAARHAASAAGADQGADANTPRTKKARALCARPFSADRSA